MSVSGRSAVVGNVEEGQVVRECGARNVVRFRLSAHGAVSSAGFEAHFAVRRRQDFALPRKRPPLRRKLSRFSLIFAPRGGLRRCFKRTSEF